MSLDLFPSQNEEDIFQQLVRTTKEEPKKAIKNVLKGFVSERYLLFLLEQAGIDSQALAGQLQHEKLREFARLCKRFEFAVNGTLSLEKAFVTGGGVSVKEIHPKEMSSKFMQGLYFCGEILDIHGYTGGYNITSALVTGRLAGSNAGEFATSLA